MRTGGHVVSGELPVELTRFVGRDHEAGQVRLLLGRTRLLTLAGAGGCGKTRLASHVVTQPTVAPPDGVRWVDLAALDDPALVGQRVAAALGVPESPGRPVTESIVEHLTGWQGLVVLDNCEHLVHACAAIADRLLRLLPGLRLLATSREPLGVTGEVTWPVPPLRLPDPHHTATVADLLRSPAAELFLDRATAACPGFTLTDHDAATVASLCCRLDGIPLAIELAAARIRVLTPAQLLDRLGRDPHVLADRGRTAVARHRTLLATMDWSHDLLTAGEQRLLRRLSVFAGGFHLEAAEAIGSCSAIPPAQVLDLLTGLVDKSLVLVEHDRDATRYRMLDTVRRYAATKLDAAGETAGVRAAHADFFLALARAAEPGLAGPQQRVWVRRLGGDHDNIAAALAWLSGHGDATGGLELAGRLGRYWWFAGQFTEGAAWLETFLNRTGTRSRDADRARALNALGVATFWHETPAAGIETARTRFEEAADIYRELGDDRALAAALRDLGGYWKGHGSAEQARDVLDQSVAAARRIGDPGAEAAATAYLGVVATYTGELEQARTLLQRSLTVLAEHGGADEAARCLFFLACLECDAGQPAAARARFEELLALDPLTALPYTAGFALDGLARLAAAERQPARALRLAGAASTTHHRLGTSAGPNYDTYVRRGLDPARRRLGDAAAQRAFQHGRSTAFDDALAEGRRPPAGPNGILSTRETEVLHLAAEGLTDTDIATHLHLSPRTVGNHLSSSYRKLGVSNRTAAIRKATGLDLL